MPTVRVVASRAHQLERYGGGAQPFQDRLLPAHHFRRLAHLCVVLVPTCRWYLGDGGVAHQNLQPPLSGLSEQEFSPLCDLLLPPVWSVQQYARQGLRLYIILSSYVSLYSYPFLSPLC